jgi:exodeoxyribonuclease VII large subunit
LWSFNDSAVAEAAFHCKTPIVAAIGHESDTSIIELVADVRASTPTQAAVALIPDSNELLQMIEHFQVRLEGLAKRFVELANSRIHHQETAVTNTMLANLHNKALRISNVSEVLIARRPHALIQKRQKRFLTCTATLKTSVQHRIAAAISCIDTLQGKLESINPQCVLSRGFSLTEDSEGNLVRSIKKVEEGQKIRTVLADGTIESTVECTL